MGGTCWLRYGWNVVITLILMTPLVLAQEPAPQSDPTQEPAATAQQEPEVGSMLDPLTEIQLICAEMESLESYTFEFKSEGSSPMGGRAGFGGRGGGQAADAAASKEGEGEKAPEPQPWIVTWQKDQPLMMQNGDFVAVRLDNVTAYKGEDGEWKRQERRSRGSFGGRGGEQGGRARGGGQGGNEGGGRPERGGRAERGGGGGGEGGGRTEITPAQRRMFEMRSIQMPGTALMALPGAVDEGQITRSNKLGLTVFEGSLTPEGAMDLMSNGRGFGGRGGGFGGRGGESGEGPQIETTGKFRVILGPKGSLKEFTYTTTMKGSFGDREFERTSQRNYKFSKHNQAKVELADDVRALLKPTTSADEEF